MRELEFRMERAGLVKEGDSVELKEDVASTMSGVIYYYTIRPAAAMSNNIRKRLPRLQGTVKSVENEEGVFTVTVQIED